MLLLSSAGAAAAGIAALLCFRNDTAARRVGLGGTLLAFLLGVYAIIFHHDQLGALSLFFTLPVMVIGLAAAFHARDYVRNHGKEWVFWGFFNLTLATMLALPSLSRFITFLIVWELMGAVSFVLVMLNYKSHEMKPVTWVYLLACEAGGLLLMLFMALGHEIFSHSPLIFAIGLAGFGIKGGFLWLPEAHPKAPAPVSALMSAAMLNLSLYGILRFVCVPEHTQIAGWTLLIFGLAGSLGGIISACGQNDLKKLLAYSSVENIGIISIALGIGFLGVYYHKPVMAVGGFAGAFLHIINHSLLKGALFLLSGQILRAAGTLEIDKLGGLMKRLPLTGLLFAGNSVALSGLPPFNAFASELLIYTGCFAAISSNAAPVRIAGVAGALFLALTGACAVAAFTKASAGTFLGEPRSGQAAGAQQESLWMTIPVLVLSIFSLLSVLVFPVLLPLICQVISRVCAYDVPPCFALILTKTAWVSVGIYVLAAAIFLIRRYLLKRGKVSRTSITWDCGYAYPSARMEYTGSALTQALTDMIDGVFKPVRKESKPEGLFPKKASFFWHLPDAVEKYFYNPVFRFFGKAADQIHRLQSGFLHFYILVMILTLLIMLGWAFFTEVGK